MYRIVSSVKCADSAFFCQYFKSFIGKSQLLYFSLNFTLKQKVGNFMKIKYKSVALLNSTVFYFFSFIFLLLYANILYNHMITQLQQLGLNEKEAKVYLASLELGKSPVQKISQKAEVNRATTYVIIEQLTKKGLMSSYTEGKKQYFCAEAPEKLNLLFRDQELEIKRKQDYLSKILPDIKSLTAPINNKPSVRYFEGKAGLRAMSEEFFMTKHEDESRQIYSYDLLKQVFSEDEMTAMRRRRQAEKIKVRSIVNDSYNEIKTDADRIILDGKKYPIKSDIALFGNKLRIATQKGDLIGMVLENKDVIDTLKIIFDLAWKYLKSSQKNNKGPKS